MLGALPGGVVLTGGGASLEGIVELAQTVFNMPVTLGLPDHGLDGVVEAVRDPALAAAVDYAVAVGADITGQLQSSPYVANVTSAWTAPATAGPALVSKDGKTGLIVAGMKLAHGIGQCFTPPPTEAEP